GEDAALLQHGAKRRAQKKDADVVVGRGGIPVDDDLAAGGHQESSDAVDVEQEPTRRSLVTHTPLDGARQLPRKGAVAHDDVDVSAVVARRIQLRTRDTR